LALREVLAIAKEAALKMKELNYIMQKPWELVR